jgi:hypothetical protein
MNFCNEAIEAVNSVSSYYCIIERELCMAGTLSERLSSAAPKASAGMTSWALIVCQISICLYQNPVLPLLLRGFVLSHLSLPGL